ncbi:MAG TPA: peptidylprolyl isomerase [Vicinamibacteria bacterium]|nr:peptidylprolyl isomerase [Vicinamibacteria bacterium]
MTFLVVFAVLAIQGTASPAKQAILETSLGEIVIDLLPEKAPDHVAHFTRLASEGVYDGTTFHRVIKYGIIQGGDPETKDPSARDKYGTGGLGVLARELSDEKHTRGAVSAVQIPGKPDSAGSQFFIVVTDQPTLDGQFTVFARVVEGILVAQRISETPTDESGLAVERIEILKVTLRDKPPPEIPPFSTESVEQLARYRAVLETEKGEITVELFPQKAPNHVRNFLRLAQIGAYDGVAFHRIEPGFVIQTGFLETRREPPSERILNYVTFLDPEFNDTPHVPGILSMARGDDPASAQASFFIVTGVAENLDHAYTAFGRVTEGMDVVRAIESLPTEGASPVERFDLLRVRVETIE